MAGQQHPPKARVLHVLKGLPLGGIETWLMHVLRQRRLGSVEHEILLMVEKPGAYEPEAKALGVTIHKVPHEGSWFGWLKRLRGFFRANRFDVVHSHLGYAVSGPVLAMAAAGGVRVRIAHQHEARSLGRDFRSIKPMLIKRAGMLLARIYATRRLGISEATIEELAGKSWRDDPNCSVLLYGFDYSGFEGAEERAAGLRRTLGVSPGQRIIGHVGRFDPVKNHDFLLRGFARLASQCSDVVLVLVGTGRLQPNAQALAAELGIADQVFFVGATKDVPAFMALFDLFVFPSFSEGLGIVCLEAQAAGTRSLVSDTVPPEVAVVGGAVTFEPIDSGVEAWAERMEALLALPPSVSGEWRRLVEQSSFGIARCVRDLDAIYREQLERAA